LVASSLSLSARKNHHALIDLENLIAPYESIFLRMPTILLLMIILGCKENTSEEHWFTLFDAAQTGLNLNNRLLGNAYMKGFFYQYYDNRTGLATADFNNDCLIDIYFISSIW